MNGKNLNHEHEPLPTEGFLFVDIFIVMNINDYLSSTSDDSVLLTEYRNFRNMFNEFCDRGVDLTSESDETESLRNQLTKISEEIENLKKTIQNNGFEITENKFFEHIYSKFNIIEEEIPFKNGNTI